MIQFPQNSANYHYKEYSMNKEKKSNKSFDPNGYYTGKFFRTGNTKDDEVVFTEPEQDADDL